MNPEESSPDDGLPIDPANITDEQRNFIAALTNAELIAWFQPRLQKMCYAIKGAAKAQDRRVLQKLGVLAKMFQVLMDTWTTAAGEKRVTPAIRALQDHLGESADDIREALGRPEENDEGEEWKKA